MRVPRGTSTSAAVPDRYSSVTPPMIAGGSIGTPQTPPTMPKTSTAKRKFMITPAEMTSMRAGSDFASKCRAFAAVLGTRRVALPSTISSSSIPAIFT